MYAFITLATIVPTFACIRIIIIMCVTNDSNQIYMLFAQSRDVLVCIRPTKLSEFQFTVAPQSRLRRCNLSTAAFFQAVIDNRPTMVYLTHGESSGGTLQPLDGMGAVCRRWELVTASNTTTVEIVMTD